MQKYRFAPLKNKKYKNLKSAHCKLIREKKFKQKQLITKNVANCKNYAKFSKEVNYFGPGKAQVGCIVLNH